ncbi:alpha/beta hydrolase [Acutalibacter sp. 1XD8-33]|nr:alpha/beta hydrolase [Acutalibacter sp. 1XD8-33]
MEEKILSTPAGEIHYWTSRTEEDRSWLVMLPGLTADHRLFDKQIEGFQGDYRCMVWDAPAHGSSRPFPLDFLMDDLTGFLDRIFQKEGIQNPLLIGQSMGGYIAQAFIRRFPGRAAGFVSIDSAPLSRSYFSGWELALLKHATWMYRSIPWRLLVKIGSEGTATSPYGRALMGEMMESYEKGEYCALAGHGYRLLALAVEAHGDREPDCSTLLLCGERDGAGSSRRYNRAWTKRTGFPLVWLKGAGHNSNTDAPEEVNRRIDGFAREIFARR